MLFAHHVGFLNLLSLALSSRRGNEGADKCDEYNFNSTLANRLTLLILHRSFSTQVFKAADHFSLVLFRLHLFLRGRQGHHSPQDW